MHEEVDMPVPVLAEAFKLAVESAPDIRVGRLATGGARSIRPVKEGRLEGRGLCADIVSGTETWLSRCDGVSTIEVSLVAMPQEGSPIRLSGTGIHVANGAAAMRMNVVFEVEDGSAHEWLATRVFVAERPDGQSAFSIFEVL